MNLEHQLDDSILEIDHQKCILKFVLNSAKNAAFHLHLHSFFPKYLFKGLILLILVVIIKAQVMSTIFFQEVYAQGNSWIGNTILTLCILIDFQILMFFCP